jgi:dTDP-4-amino-4,6-dideoxygalactose transaminase
MTNNYLIPNTKTVMPPMDNYARLIHDVWNSRIVTNNGPMLISLENELAERFSVKHAMLISNGTLALQLSIRALNLKGNILTTPFTYIATLNSILWENCSPIFCDIDENTFCINPETVTEAIGNNDISGILLTNVFGNPGSIDNLVKVAKDNNLKIIFDSSHCFDVKFDNNSVFNYGNISTLSLHATKIFQTGEGGAVFTNDDLIASRIKLLRNFGHTGTNDFSTLGINAKMSELHAALGLANLPYISNHINARKNIVENYENQLNHSYRFQKFEKKVQRNYSYFPIIVRSETRLLEIKDVMEANRIECRRYFYPSLNTLKFIEKGRNMPVSEDISSRILCLPLYPEMTPEDNNKVINILNSFN